MDRVFERIGHPDTGVVPSSRRICEDVRKIVGALKAIVAAKGCVVHGWMKRPGHRGEAAAEGAPENRVKKHGGARVKKQSITFFDLHEDAAEVEREFINKRINILSRGSVVGDERAASTHLGDTEPAGDVLEVLEVHDESEDLCSIASAEISVGEGQ